MKPDPMKPSDIRFWTCVVCAGIDIALAFLLPPETQELFLLCALCFAFGAVINYVHNDE